jgi:Na+/H+ antiporter NhaD/arsenite permease-like protein
VSNIGGSLTPLGDPPLFVGFLRGVDFFWTTQHLWLETLFVGALVLAVFLAIDLHLYKTEEKKRPIKDPTPDSASSYAVSSIFRCWPVSSAQS